MGFIFLFIILLLVGFIYLLRTILKKQQKKISVITYAIIIAYVISLCIAGIGLMLHSSQYNQAVDPVDGDCYTPFGGKHALSLFFYFVAFHISAVAIWVKGRKIPPIPLVLALIMLMIGSVISVFVIYQVSHHDTSTLNIYVGNDGTLYFIFAPLLSLFIGISLIRGIIIEERKNAMTRTYANIALNKINSLLSSRLDFPLWALIFLIPILLLSTIILILLGQDSNSLMKVFTETTTWAFSQKMHPPILDHQGHYLCTVAAKGDPAIVKPLRLGKRHGNIIIVNRQLQVANAFEQILSDLSPTIHRYVRYCYDQYGFNISIRINSVKASNVTYIVMKPLEYLFIFFLYTFYVEPEKKISKQYA